MEMKLREGSKQRRAGNLREIALAHLLAERVLGELGDEVRERGGARRAVGRGAAREPEVGVGTRQPEARVALVPHAQAGRVDEQRRRRREGAGRLLATAVGGRAVGRAALLAADERKVGGQVLVARRQRELGRGRRRRGPALQQRRWQRRARVLEPKPFLGRARELRGRHRLGGRRRGGLERVRLEVHARARGHAEREQCCN
jgi:hypothetical protein